MIIYRTAESVRAGHPDKVADQLSDTILDAVLSDDKSGRVACEVMVSSGLVMIAGEITTDCYVDIPFLVREKIKRIGYDSPILGFDGNSCAILTTINEQSPDIAQGVDQKGAGDQGSMFGFATNETPEMMPLPIWLSHRLMQEVDKAYHHKKVDFLRPDGKCQVTVEYHDGLPKRVDNVVISLQHEEKIESVEIEQWLRSQIFAEVLGDFVDKKTKVMVNSTGNFVIGGPVADCGLTGRKIIVDTYGEAARHGGGCFSGKDPSKVDRSAAYMARYIAKSVVASELATQCEVQLSYGIGLSEATAMKVDTFGTGVMKDDVLLTLIQKNFDCRPAAVIKTLDLLQPIYAQTAVYGHFGRNEPGMTWEHVLRLK